MNPVDVLARIEELEQRLTALRKQEATAQSQGAAPDDAAATVRTLQTELDALWDLRRRQDAARSAGATVPTDVRPPGTVGGYQQ